MSGARGRPGSPFTTSGMATLSRSDRLDRLPFTRLHRRILGIAGIGWAMDATGTLAEEAA